MKKKKKIRDFVPSAIILCAFLSTAVGEIPLWGQPTESLVLAYVDVEGSLLDLGLPVYAHLQDRDGKEYALVIAPPRQLDRSNVSYRILDENARATSYLIAQERRPGARGRVGQSFRILLDDGQHLVLSATPEQISTLSALGLKVRRLRDAPVVLRIPSPDLVALLATEYDPTIAAMVGQVDQATLYAMVGDLSGEWPAVVGGSNYTITTRETFSGIPIQKATQYAYEHFQDAGLDVSYHDWSYSVYSNRNVIGEKIGTERPEEIVLFTAHIDSIAWSGPRAPGADDNASGSAAVMVIAEIFENYEFERTIRFICFTGEEQGLLGSYEYADKVFDDGDNIVAVVNADMIAWDEEGGPTLRLHTRTAAHPGYPGDRAIADLFSDVVGLYGMQGSLIPIIDPDGEDASDHTPFWEMGWPAVFAIEDDEDDFNWYYHTSEDSLDKLNLTYYTNFVRASLATVAHLAVVEGWGYVLDGYGGVHPAGGSSPMSPSTPYFGFDIAKDLELAATGYYVLDGFGGVHIGGGAPAVAPATPYFAADVARDMELGPNGYYVMDGFGGVHAGGAAAALSPPTPYFGFDIARDLELAATGYYLLDGFGGIHAGGGATAMTPTAPYFGFDIGRDLELDVTGYYVLDGFGGVHAGGGAVLMSPSTPYFGFDIARDMELLGGGVHVLDGFGGIHEGGGASPISPTIPYFGFDIARDLERR